tara:strand:- start:1031 stop:1489 length:459 start_codon:yes stop_codon:yes gene_type:complete
MADTRQSTNDWLLRCGDGENFKNSSKFSIWGISSASSNKHFLKNVKIGDRLWFVKSKSKGQLIAVATYCSYNTRVGQLIDVSLTNKELGWTGTDWTADIEIHYKELYGLINCELLTEIKSPMTIRKYNDKCKVNLPLEYKNIVRYCKVTSGL